MLIKNVELISLANESGMTILRSVRLTDNEVCIGLPVLSVIHKGVSINFRCCVNVGKGFIAKFTCISGDLNTRRRLKTVPVPSTNNNW